MIKKNDAERLARFFPDEDWDKLFWGFTCHSRQNYAANVPLEAEDEIMLGIQSEDGGCLCELCIAWYEPYGELVPQLKAFSQAWHLLQTPTFQMILDQVITDIEPLPTSDELSALLIACGFVDQSDQPLPGASQGESH